MRMNRRTHKKAVVFGNGDLADVSRVRAHIDKDTLLIGCDGGAGHILSLGLTPHAVIGDFDSISARDDRALRHRKVEYIRYPREKLYTDTELGVALARKRGCREIILTGIRGTSTDHMFGNIFLLAKKKFASLNIKIIEGKEEMMLARKRIRIKGKIGDIVSLIAISGNASGITTKGLFYPIVNDALSAGSARGIRNRMTSKHAEITVRKGSLLVIHSI